MIDVENDLFDERNPRAFSEKTRPATHAYLHTFLGRCLVLGKFRRRGPMDIDQKLPPAQS